VCTCVPVSPGASKASSRVGELMTNNNNGQQQTWGGNKVAYPCIVTEIVRDEIFAPGHYCPLGLDTAAMRMVDREGPYLSCACDGGGLDHRGNNSITRETPAAASNTLAGSNNDSQGSSGGSGSGGGGGSEAAVEETAAVVCLAYPRQPAWGLVGGWLLQCGSEPWGAIAGVADTVILSGQGRLHTANSGGVGWCDVLLKRHSRIVRLPGRPCKHVRAPISHPTISEGLG
jgi:hypothetical protein